MNKIQFAQWLSCVALELEIRWTHQAKNSKTMVERDDVALQAAYSRGITYMTAAWAIHRAFPLDKVVEVDTVEERH